MRAARLLRTLLLLQNRGRMTSAELAAELEVARRTVLRDVDAMTEAGLPVIVHRGAGGGIELGFNYRARLTGLATDEAEALAHILARPMPELAALGLADAGRRAAVKLVESLPDRVRGVMEAARGRLRFEEESSAAPDPRVPAMAAAVREGRIVRLHAHGPGEREIHPLALSLGHAGWAVIDAREPGSPVPLADWGRVNISARRFAI